MGAGCSSPAPSPPGVAPFAPDSVAPAEPSSTPPTRVEADASSPGNSVRLRALGAAYGEVAAIEGERYVVKTGAGYDSVAADELSADAKRAKTGGA
jgi:hypothetical protein